MGTFVANMMIIISIHHLRMTSHGNRIYRRWKGAIRRFVFHPNAYNSLQAQTRITRIEQNSF